MKKFRFRLAAVLDVRKRKEQDALVQLAKAQQEYQRAVQVKKDYMVQLSISLDRRESLGSVATPALSFQLEQNFIYGIKQKIVQSDQGIVRASRGVEKALRVFLLARRQTRMIEAIEEKERRAFKIERSKYEQKQVDELVTMRARLNQGVA